MELHHFFTAQRVLIVAGKGGVGKSAIAAGLALTSARSGLRTLLVSLDPVPLDVPEHELLERAMVTPGGALGDYLASKGLGLLSRQLAKSGLVELVASTAPGLDDLLVLGRLKAFDQEERADVIIVDGPAAGHALDLVRAPIQLKGAISSGPINSQSDEILDFLRDGARCKMVMVTTAAITPVAETIEAINSLQATVDIALASIMVNKCDRDVPAISAELSTPLSDAYIYACTRHAAQQNAIAQLSDATQVSQLHVSRYRLDGRALIEEIATDIAKQLETTQ